MILGTQTELPSDFDPTSRGWYQQAKEADAMIVTDPYVDFATGNMVISVAYPVKRDGKIIGVTGADIEIAELVDLVGQISVEEGSYGFLVDSQNMFVTHVNEAYLPTQDGATLVEDVLNQEVIDLITMEDKDVIFAKDYDNEKICLQLHL